MAILTVAPDGKDTGPGSPTSPFRSIPWAVGKALDGDTVLVRGGVYKEATKLQIAGVTLSAYPTPTGYEGVIIDGEYMRPDIPGPAGGTNKDGTWFDFNYASLVEIMADRCHLYGIHVLRSKGRGIEVGGLDDVRRTTGNVIEDCSATDSRHAGIGAKYFNSLTVRRCKNVGAGNFAQFRRPTMQGVPGNHPMGCSFQVGDGLLIEGLESSISWGEGVGINNVIHGRASGVKSGDHMVGGIYFNAVADFVLDGWTCYYSDVGRTAVAEQIQAGVFINRENHKSDWGALENICENIVIKNGVAVNCDRGISLLGALGLFEFRNISFIGNTIVRPSWKPKSGQSSGIFCAGQGRFRNIRFEDNLIALTDTSSQTTVTSPSDPNIVWNRNFWSHRPPVAQRSAADVYGDPMLTNPLAQIVAGNIDLENYRLRPTSPAAGFGALQPLAGEPVTVGRVQAMRAGLRSGIRIGVG
jgi:hypothetical protein